MSTVRLMNVAAAGMSLCALFLTAAVVKREFFSPPPVSTARIRRLPEWTTFARGNYTMGDVGSRIVVTEFSDFQCPYCAKAAAELHKAQAKYPGQVLIVFRNLPLSFHPYARAAAQAAICAGNQGRFAAYHDALFEKQDSLGHVSWAQFAERSGLADGGAFAACMRDTAKTNRILARDSVDADKLGASSTPTLIVNDLLIRGMPSSEEFDKILGDARKVDGSRVRPHAD